MTTVDRLPTTEELVRVLQARFGWRYEEAYEHGKREFEGVLKEAFDLSGEDARQLIHDLEQAQVLRYFKASAGRGSDAPHVGLFDEPGEVPPDRPEEELTSRHWRIGREEEVAPIATGA